MEELTCTLPGRDVLSMREEQLICDGRKAFIRCGAGCQRKGRDACWDACKLQKPLRSS